MTRTDAGAAAESGFPSTRWSRILGPAEDPSRRRSLWEALAAAYWKPVYACVRARWARTDEDARDGTQEFFLWMMSGLFLERADPRRGRFRGYVKTALDNFLCDLERKRRTVKRGGGRTLVSLHGAGEEMPSVDPEDARGRSPEELLDELWRRELFERAVRGLEAGLEGEGKGLAFRVFRDYFLAEAELDYRAVAARHGIRASDVSNHLQLAKRRFRSALRDAVAETVADADELEAELAWLTGRPGR